MADFRVFNEGTVIGVAPQNAETLDWLEDNTDQFAIIGLPIWGDHRPMRDIITALEEAGFTGEPV